MNRSHMEHRQKQGRGVSACVPVPISNYSQKDTFTNSYGYRKALRELFPY